MSDFSRFKGAAEVGKEDEKKKKAKEEKKTIQEDKKVRKKTRQEEKRKRQEDKKRKEEKGGQSTHRATGRRRRRRRRRRKRKGHTLVSVSMKEVIFCLLSIHPRQHLAKQIPRQVIHIHRKPLLLVVIDTHKHLFWLTLDQNNILGHSHSRGAKSIIGSVQAVCR